MQYTPRDKNVLLNDTFEQIRLILGTWHDAKISPRTKSMRNCEHKIVRNSKTSERFGM